MRNFREDLLTNEKLVVHCPKKEQAKELLLWAASKGSHWRGGQSYLTHTYWYKEEMCYLLAKGEYARKGYYTHENYTILTFEEALLPEPEYTYLKTATGDNIPDWWTGEPILVYYSDNSEEEAVKDGHKGWLVGISNKDDYPYIISRFTRTDNISYIDMIYYQYDEFKYVVPVPKNPPAPKVKATLTITRDGEESTIDLTEDQLKELGLC